ncbi:hypothetical protein H4Q26_013436 [Puccinia striiformis f. sp. tritici PST-130]|nr:hypothetical protein H4Q26_013436 [Puccinia striiformis f. sp. tritici PST-130]
MIKRIAIHQLQPIRLLLIKRIAIHQLQPLQELHSSPYQLHRTIRRYIRHPDRKGLILLTVLSIIGDRKIRDIFVILSIALIALAAILSIVTDRLHLRPSSHPMIVTDRTIINVFIVLSITVVTLSAILSIIRDQRIINIFIFVLIARGSNDSKESIAISI